MKNQLIQAELSKIDSQTKKIEKRMKRIKAIQEISGAFFTSFAVVTFPFLPLLGIGNSLLAGLCIYNGRKVKDQIREELKQLGNEKKHLEQIKNTALENSPTLKNRRNQKVASLKNVYQNNQDNTKGANITATISDVVTVAGAVATVLNPVFGIVGAAGLLGSIIFGEVENSSYKKVLKTKTRIHNLERDIKVGAAEEREQRLRAQANQTNQQQNQQTNQLNNQQANQRQVQPLIDSHSSNQSLIDDYLNNIASRNNQKNPQKVKK